MKQDDVSETQANAKPNAHRDAHHERKQLPARGERAGCYTPRPPPPRSRLNGLEISVIDVPGMAMFCLPARRR